MAQTLLVVTLHGADSYCVVELQVAAQLAQTLSDVPLHGVDSYWVDELQAAAQVEQAKLVGLLQ